MLLVFGTVFSVPVISRIEFIGSGWVGGVCGEWWGQVGSRRWGKAPIWTQRAVLCLQKVTWTDTIHNGGPDYHTPCSPINVPQDHEMHPWGFTASGKAICKSRPGNLLSSAWCFWIVHECAYYIQAKYGFQFLYLVFQNTVTYY